MAGKSLGMVPKTQEFDLHCVVENTLYKHRELN